MFMTNVINEILEVGQEVIPNAPAVQAVAAISETIANPNPVNIVADIELATNLVTQLKANLAGTHPSIMGLIKALL
jgi:hypothetical protein